MIAGLEGLPQDEGIAVMREILEFARSDGTLDQLQIQLEQSLDNLRRTTAALSDADLNRMARSARSTIMSPSSPSAICWRRESSNSPGRPSAIG